MICSFGRYQCQSYGLHYPAAITLPCYESNVSKFHDRTCLGRHHCLRLCNTLIVPDNDLQLVEPKRLTLAQLKEYDGSDKKKPIYLAIRGIVFDVSRGEGLHLQQGSPNLQCIHTCGQGRIKVQQKMTQMFPRDWREVGL